MKHINSDTKPKPDNGIVDPTQSNSEKTSGGGCCGGKK